MDSTTLEIALKIGVALLLGAAIGWQPEHAAVIEPEDKRPALEDARPSPGGQHQAATDPPKPFPEATRVDPSKPAPKPPADADAIERSVRSLIGSGRWEEALAEARRFARDEPSPGRTSSDLARIHTALGEALYRAGRIGESKAVLEEVVASSDSPPPRALLGLGLIRVAEGRDEEAATLLGRALGADPSDREIVFWAAGAARTRVRAVELLERYLSMSEGDDPDRIEGARGTIRLYKALGEKKVWVPASRPSKLEAPLSTLVDRSGRVTGFVVEIGSGTGKKPVRVLLDTGSTGLFLLERIAVKAGFAPLSEETTFAGGGTGRLPSRRGLMPSVAIGGLRFTDALVSTTTEEIEPTGRYHGLLGTSIFDGYRVTLDLARRKLVLDAPAGDTPAVNDSSAAHDSRAKDPVAVDRNATGTRYWTVSSQLLVEAGTSDGRSGLFLFDTGASTSLVSLDFAARGSHSGLGEATSIRGYGGPIREARKVSGLRLRFQGLESPEPSMNASDLRQRSRLGGVEVSGFLGLDMLNRTKIHIDTAARLISVQKP